MGQSIPREIKEFCFTRPISKWKVSSTCARAVPADGGKEACFSETLWKEVLDSGNRCVLLHGWDRFSSFPLLEGGKKETAKRFRVERVEIKPEVGKAWHLGPNELLRVSLVWFEIVRERLGRMIPRGAAGGLFRLLILGETDPDSETGIFRLTGFVHVLNATGLHLYALFTAIEALLLGSIRLGVSVPTRGRSISRGVSLLFCVFAWGCTGFRFGMVRPFLIVCLRKILNPKSARWRLIAPLFLALALDLGWAWIRGETLLSGPQTEGRILYALSVGGGLLGMGLAAQGNVQGVWRTHAGMALGSWWFAALWEVSHTGLLSPWTPVLSLLSIPFLVGVLYPLLFGALVLGLSGETDFAVKGITFLADWVEGFLSGAVRILEMVGGLVWIPGSALWAGIALALLSFVFHRRRLITFPVCIIGALLLRLCVALPAVAEPQKEATQVEQLDIGQGDAALIRWGRGEAGLIDAGSERAIARESWLRAFSKRGILRLRFIALTHLDEDHLGGLLRLATLIRIDAVITSSLEWETSRGNALRTWLLAKGIRAFSWEESDFPFRFLSPLPLSDARAKGNARMSAVAIPILGSALYVNAGDAEGAAEVRAMKWFQALSREGKRDMILKASHHGSRFSSTEEALSGIHAREIWVSAGVGNLYGHPTEEALHRLADHGGVIRRTDQEGTLGVPDELKR